MPIKYRIPDERLRDPAGYINRQAQGKVADLLLRGVEPFDWLVNKGKEADARIQADLPPEMRYKGANELVAEQVTPIDIALAAAPMAKYVKPGASKALKFLTESEVGAVGKIGPLIEAEKAAKGAKTAGKSAATLLDFDLAGARPRDVGANPRFQGTDLRTQKLNPREGLADLSVGDFTGSHSSKTGTFGLTGPNGEKIAGKIHPDYIEMTSIGKGKAENSKSAVDALRNLGNQQGKPVYFTSTNLSESGGKFRGRMMERGDLVQTEKGLQLRGTGKEASSEIGLGKTPPPQQPPNTPSGNVPGGGGKPPSAQNPPGGGQAPKPQVPRKKASLFQNILGTPKSLKSVIDIPTARQAVVPALTHPIDVGLPSIKAGLKSEFGSGKMYQDVLDEIKARPFHDIYEKYGFQIPESEIRQQFPAAWPEQIEEALGIAGPITRSERGYDASLKIARANLADPLIQKAINKYSGYQGPSKAAGLGAVPESEIKGIANFVNDFTGYGTLGPAEKAADILAAPFFSPRMIASRAQMMNPVNYLGGSRWGDIGKSAARADMAKFIGGTGLGLAGIAAAGGDVETDPRSSDFASPKIGNTTFDLLGGMRPMVNAGARIATGTAKSAREDQDIYPVDRSDTSLRFLRSKLGPGVPSMAGDWLLGNGKNLIGQPIEASYQSGPFEDVPYLPWLVDQVSPMYPGDVTEAFEQSGPEGGIPAAALGLLGAGSTSYDRTPIKFQRRKKRTKK